MTTGTNKPQTVADVDDFSAIEWVDDIGKEPVDPASNEEDDNAS